jgi:hypothetical protein
MSKTQEYFALTTLHMEGQVYWIFSNIEKRNTSESEIPLFLSQLLGTRNEVVK